MMNIPTGFCYKSHCYAFLQVTKGRRIWLLGKEINTFKDTKHFLQSYEISVKIRVLHMSTIEHFITAGLVHTFQHRPQISRINCGIWTIWINLEGTGYWWSTLNNTFMKAIYSCGQNIHEDSQYHLKDNCMQMNHTATNHSWYGYVRESHCQELKQHAAASGTIEV